MMVFLIIVIIIIIIISSSSSSSSSSNISGRSYFKTSSLKDSDRSPESQKYMYSHSTKVKLLWVWWPFRSCDLDFVYKHWFPLPIDASYKFGFDWPKGSRDV